MTEAVVDVTPREDIKPLQPLVISVVLNMNRRHDTLECLSSLERTAHARSQVMVLDCLSQDGSAEAVRMECPGVTVVELLENRGYAGNNNIGLRAALDMGADWVFVLNNDVTVAPDCLPMLLSVGEAHADIGVVGPMVFHHDEPGVIQSAGGVLSARWEGVHLGQNEDDEGQFKTPRDVDWLSGCALLIRRDVLKDVGLFDERFFAYWEETEWCVRARRAGWRIVHVPAAKLWHKGVQRDYRPRPAVTYYLTRNRLLMLLAHRAPLSARLLAWAQIARTLTSWSLRPKWRDRRPHRDAMWQGICDYLRGRWGERPQ